MDWLNENDEHSMDILRNAYNRDKADNFPQTSEHTKFSNSVVDVFTQLNEALKVLKQVLNNKIISLTEYSNRKFKKSISNLKFKKNF